MLIDIISKDLTVPRSILDSALKKARIQVKSFNIKKKNGARLICQPSNRLKLIHYWLIENVFKQMDIHNAAMAFQKSVDIKKNAYKHKSNRYFLKLDFENFFPSLTFDDFSPFLDIWCNKGNDYNEIVKDSYSVINKSCFYKYDCLPIGYPTSPIISNIIMYDFDLDISNILNTNLDILGKVVYTRYADDLVFSTNKRSACKQIEKIITEKLTSMDSPKLRLNNKKTRYLSSSGGSALVTGLRICYDEHITIHRKYKNRIRGMIHKYRLKKLSESGLCTLRGHLSYIKYVDPVYYTKLSSCYFNDIDAIFS